jgi:Na+/H+-dicarboxylate symporter
MRKIAFHWQVIMGLILGIGYASLAIHFSLQEFTAFYIAPIGDIFIRLLKLIAVPLVLFSIISGITSLKSIEELGRVGVKTLLLYLFTTVCAISIGLALVNLIQPGKIPASNSRLEKRIDYELWLSENPTIKRLDERCYTCDSKNNLLVAKVFESRKANTDDTYVAEKIAIAQKSKKSSPLQPIVDMIPSNIFLALASMEMLQIIFFGIFFGIVLLRLPKDKTTHINALVDGLNEVFIKMVNILIKGMPIFVFALMGANLVKAAGNDLQKLIEQLVFLLNYAWVVVLGLLLVAYVFYPLLILVLTKQNRYRSFLKGISDAQITAFSTSSSLATLPVTLECVNDKLDVPKSISTFVLPIGATVNMDGTSLYQAVAVVALAQFHMIDLSLNQQLVIILTTTLASIGTAAVPSAGLVLMIVVLESVGLNPAWIAIILPIDRILDMFRTVVNVTGDAAVSVIVAATEKHKTV